MFCLALYWEATVILLTLLQQQQDKLELAAHLLFVPIYICLYLSQCTSTTMCLLRRQRGKSYPRTNETVSDILSFEADQTLCMSFRELSTINQLSYRPTTT